MTDDKRDPAEVLARARRAWSPGEADAARVRRAIGATLAAGPAPGGGAAPARPRGSASASTWTSRFLVAGAIAAASGGAGYWAGHRAGMRDARPTSSVVSLESPKARPPSRNRRYAPSPVAETPPLAMPSLVPSRHDAHGARRGVGEPNALADRIPGDRGARAPQCRARAARRKSRAGAGLPAGARSPGPERPAGRGARRGRHARPLRPRRSPVRREPGGGVHRAPPRKRLPRPRRAGLRRQRIRPRPGDSSPEEVRTMKNERNGDAGCSGVRRGAPLACSGGGAVNIGNTNGDRLAALRLRGDLGRLRGGVHLLPDGSDRVHLTIDANGQGTLRGRRHRAACRRPPIRTSAIRLAATAGTANRSSRTVTSTRSTPRVQADPDPSAGCKPSDYYAAGAPADPVRRPHGYLSRGAPRSVAVGSPNWRRSDHRLRLPARSWRAGSVTDCQACR